ncbi:hypothetical protein [Paenibacillus sp. Soil522]|uniref:hypothetical protein n=1 Tax=Paenibacillus sp. Soil522 TaxID=1736388 RepID=UPI00138F0C6B|nr:hypothetical protein [Paenibacillus sp. Soil522]
MKLFITAGHIVSKFEGTLIDTGLSPVTFYLPEGKKVELVKHLEEKGHQDWLVNVAGQAMEDNADEE